jgi:hypothetical protein
MDFPQPLERGVFAQSYKRLFADIAAEDCRP